MNLNIRISGELEQYLLDEMKAGNYESTSEFIRSLIRKDKLDKEQIAFEHLKSELTLAFSEDNDQGLDITAQDVINRNKKL